MRKRSLLSRCLTYTVTANVRAPHAVHAEKEPLCFDLVPWISELDWAWWHVVESCSSRNPL